jgi:dTDP-4-dehydrorhamnose reductase
VKILLLGAGGQLASDLVPALAGHDVVELRHAAFEIIDRSQVEAAVADHRPDAVINTSAFHRVDDCEEQLEKSFAVNAAGVGHLARACAERGATLVHLSTDYVFAGDKGTPYLEDDPTHPQTVYGASKVAGETLVRQRCPRHFIVRTSGLYGVAGASGKGGNFVNLMLRLADEGKPIKVVADQVTTPTATADLARTIARLLSTEAYGTYHVTNGGQCSWFEFASAIFAGAGLEPDLTPTTTAAFGAKARRPAYSVLGHGHLQAQGLDDLRPWSVALRAYLSAIGRLRACVGLA